MRLSRRLACIGALVALAMALSASTAMGGTTSLCEEHEDPCASANQMGWFHMVAGTTVLKTSIATVLCLSSLAVVAVGLFGSTLANPINAFVEELTYSKCGTNAAHSNCTVENKDVITLIDILKTALNLGTATMLHPEVLVNCSGIIHCSYGGSSTGPFSVEGAGHNFGSSGWGMFTANEMSIPTVGGLLCPAKSFLTALYEPLQPTYISS